MILLDTNIILDALLQDEPYHVWARAQIEQAVSGEGAAVNAVTVAELCAGTHLPQQVESDLWSWGVEVLDMPAAAAPACGKAYHRYLLARKRSGGGVAPRTPLPDFFIGAHAEVMRWKLATRDVERIARYFPGVELLTPPDLPPAPAAGQSH